MVKVKVIKRYSNYSSLNIIKFFTVLSIGIVIYIFGLYYCKRSIDNDATYNRSNSLESISPTYPINKLFKSNLKLFYIYNWTNDIINSWPINYTHHRLSIHAHFHSNYGAGILKDSRKGLYHTHQYSLFTLFYQRLLHSPYRTMDPSQASMFFIPYDVGMDSSTRRNDGALYQTNCPNVQKVIDQLLQSKYFNTGSNHFLLHTINHMMLYYINKPCRKLYKVCYNCTKLSIDVYTPKIYSYLKDHPYMIHNWKSIPFPSDYHLYPMNTTNPPWLDIILYQSSTSSTTSSSTNSTSTNSITTSTSTSTTLKQSVSLPTIKHSEPLHITFESLHDDRYNQYMKYQYYQQRIYPLCFIGSSKVTSKLQKQLRIEIINTCKLISNQCLLIELPSHESSSSSHLVNNNNNNNNNNAIDNKAISDITNLLLSKHHPYESATFCLTPGGDFPTRKGFFDALLSGCIPVVFELTSAYEQWSWHWGNSNKIKNGNIKSNNDNKKVISDTILYIPREVAIKNITQVFEYLIRLSKDQQFIIKKLIAIAKIGTRMQYSIPNQQLQSHKESSFHYESNSNRIKNIYHHSNISSYIYNKYMKKDAIDIILDHILS